MGLFMDKKYFGNKLLCSIVEYYYNKIGNKQLHTIGCELSEWDGERIIEKLGIDEPAIIINTCAVTESAKMVSDKVSKILKRIYPNEKIFITGCGVDYKKNCGVYGTELVNEIKFDSQKYNIPVNPTTQFKHNVMSDVGLVKIQDGCSNKCSYCIIPKLRKYPYSLPYEDICRQIKTHITNGKKIIRLIGTEVCKYKDKNNVGLNDLIKMILNDFPEVEKLTFNALDPSSKEVIDIVNLTKTNKRLSNIIELSVQSGSNKVLSDMNRHYKKDVLYKLHDIADGLVGFCWHLIVGFPTETDELFKETLQTINDTKPVSISIHPFSLREGTEAEKFQNVVSKEQLNERMLKLKEYVYNNQSYENELHITSVINENVYKNKPIDINLVDSDIPNHIYGNLYNEDEVIKIANILKKQRNVYISTKYDFNGNNMDLEVNNKILTYIFSANIILNIDLNDDTIEYFNNNLSILKDICLHYTSIIRFIPGKITNVSNLKKFISIIYCNGIYSKNKLYNDFKIIDHDLTNFVEMMK